mgnify:CR=1 FL=1
MRNRKIPILGGCLGLGFFYKCLFYAGLRHHGSRVHLTAEGGHAEGQRTADLQGLLLNVGSGLFYVIILALRFLAWRRARQTDVWIRRIHNQFLSVYL